MLTRTLALFVGLLVACPLLAAGNLEQIEQAERALAAGDDREAEKIMSRIESGSLDAVALARLQIVRAELALKRQKPRGALHALPRTSDHVPQLAPKIELLRGQGWFMEGNPVYAVRVLTQRERYLKTDEALARNRAAIWEGLIAAPIPPSTLTELDRESRMTRGWIDLALVMQDGVTPDAIRQWQTRHGGHPAAELAQGLGGGATPEQAPASGIAGIPSTLPGLVTSGSGYALLLPTTGPLALAGQAIRDGFVSAWFEGSRRNIPVRVYDTAGGPARVLEALSEAQRDGAKVIIGPLDRPGISLISGQRYPLEPWLALNYVDQPGPQPLQFGLSPEDEAHAAARDAIAQGLRQALVIAPANEWGNRAVDAFREVFELEGGIILETTRYPLERRDLTRPLQTLLGVDASKQRNRELDQILGERTVFEAATRKDAQLLYAPLRASEAQTLKPKLKFIDAPAMPIYMLSAAHQGHISAQLGGIRLCDMPWVLQPTGYWIAQRERAARDFPELVRSQPRLFALGFDAFRIAQKMDARALDSGTMDAATGRLTAVGRRVERAVNCYSLPELEPEFSEESLVEDNDAGDEGT